MLVVAPHLCKLKIGKKMKKIVIIVSLLLSGYCSGQNAYSTPHNYDNQPLYSPDFGLIERALNNRQSKYNDRLSVINTKVGSITQLITRIRNRNGGFTESQIGFLQNYVENLNKCYYYDFSVDANHYNVYYWLIRVENRLFDWL